MLADLRQRLLGYAALIAVAVATAGTALAQTELPPEVIVELDRRGIDEADLRQRLSELGIDPDALTEQQILLLRPEIERIVEELEAEAAADGRGGETRDRADGRSDYGEPPNWHDSIPPTTAPSRPRTTNSRDLRIPTREEQPVREGDQARTRRPPTRLRDSALVADTLVRDSVPPIYGHAIFEDGSVELLSGDGFQDVPDDYRIGVADRLAINIFGASQLDLVLTVDRSGFISPPRTGKIYVRGLTLRQARELVAKRLSRSYLFTEGQFALNVDGSRRLRVNVFGEVKQSGTYAFGIANGVFNALVAAGGPTEQGSVRRVQRSRGSETEVIDVYAYLTDPGSMAANVALESGDVVFVPIANKVVTVEGAVRRPMRYELLERERLGDLLAYAGGLASDAVPELLQVRRLVRGRLVTIDIDVTSGGESFGLDDGDVVVARRVEAPATQSIVVRGAVDLAGEFAFPENERLGQLVRRARLRRNARTDVAFLRRTNPDSSLTLIEVSLDGALRGGEADVALQANDTLEVLSQNLYADRAHISVTGAVRRPLPRFNYANDSTLTVAGALLLAGGRTPNAADEGILFRREASNRKVTRYQMVDFDADGAIVRLNPFDSLIVFPKELFADSFQVEIKGAVRRPGKYTYDPSLGLRQLFTLAGGFKQEAALNRIEVFRLVFGENRSTETRLGTITMNAQYEVVEADIDMDMLRPYDVIAVRAAPEYEITKQISVDGEITFPGDYPLNPDIRTVSDLLRAAGGITDEAFPAGATMWRQEGNVGYVILELDEVVSDPNSPNNIILLEGDEVYIPKATELVSIRTRGTRARQSYADSLLAGGEVVVAYQGPRSARWYIEEFAGGFDERADKGTVTVRDPSGRFRRTRSVVGFKDYPAVEAGSSIALELKPLKVPKTREERLDWSGIAGAVTTALAAGLSIILIIQNLRPARED